MDADMNKTPADLVEEYIKLRDQKEEAESISKEFVKENYTSRMDAIEATMLNLLNNTGLNSFAGPSGTAFKKLSTSVTVADQREFRRHIIGSEQWDLADWRANKTTIDAMAEKGEPLPPGVNRTAFFTVQIRRKS